MIEGDPRVVDWQTWEDWHKEPAPPDGFAPGGPWYPFATAAVAGEQEGRAAHVVTYRRPLVKAEPERDALASLATAFDEQARTALNEGAAYAFRIAAEMVRAAR